MKQGIIYYLNAATEKFVVELANFSYTVFESSNISSFSIGDIVSGSLSKTGLIEILNITTQKMEQVIIRNIDCTLELAIEVATHGSK